jgi:hypothetical protein
MLELVFKYILKIITRATISLFGLRPTNCSYTMFYENEESVTDKNDVVRGHKKAKLVTFCI